MDKQPFSVEPPNGKQSDKAAKQSSTHHHPAGKLEAWEMVAAPVKSSCW